MDFDGSDKPAEVRLRRLERELDDLRHRVTSVWRGRVAEQLDEMLTSPDRAAEFLKHPDANVRGAAVYALHEHGNIEQTTAHLNLLEDVAFADPNPEVRGLAIVTLAHCCQGTDDVRIGFRLASVVLDERQNPDIRMAAYHGLYTIHGRLRALETKRRGDLLEDVDWDYVNRFLDTSRVAEPVPDLPASLRNAPQEKQLLFMYWREAEAAIKRGDDQAALEPMTAYLRLEPAPGAYLGRARAYLRLGRLDEALSDCNQAMTLAPDLAAAYEVRADVYARQGQIEQATADRVDAAKLRAKRTGWE